MTSDTSAEFDGKRAWIEVREGRRWHRVVVAVLKKEEGGLFAIFREAYPEHYPEPAKIKIPDKQLGHFQAVDHPDYDFTFSSVLYRVDHQSEDSGAWVRPPIFVTQADIEAAQKEEANQPVEATATAAARRQPRLT